MLYLLTITLFFAGTLTAYANIFGTSFGAYVSLWGEDCDYSSDSISSDCIWKYRVLLLLFLVLMIYFTVIEFHEQVWMQVTLTALRVFIIAGVVVTCVLALILRKNLSNGATFQGGNPPLADVSMLGRTLPILFFSGLYQTIFPSVIQSIRKEVPVFLWIVTLVTISLMLGYSFIGLSAAFEIHNIPSNVSLAYRNFTFGESRDNRSIWTVIFSYLIVLFPALDVVSIFPIVSHAISDNIISAVYGTNRAAILTEHRVAFYTIRVLAILPSFLYAMVQMQLGTIIGHSGLLSFFLILIMIPLCHITSRYFIPVHSPYEAAFSPNVTFMQWVSFLIFLLSLPLLALNVYTLV